MYKLSKEKTDVAVGSDEEKAEESEESSPKKLKKPDNTAASKNKKVETKQPEKKQKLDNDELIPSIFENKKFYLTKNAKDVEKLKRYIKA